MTSTISKRKEQIIEVAQNLFREHGYYATSMRDIAKEVGIEPPSLYSHFDSKEAILSHVCFHIANEFFEFQEPILNGMSHPVDKLKELIAGHVNVIIQNLDAAAVFFNEWRHLPEPELTRFVEMRERYEKGFHDVMMDGITTGDFRMGDVAFTVRMIFSVINDIHAWYRLSGNVRPHEVGEKMSDFILNGVGMG